jgi:hypothetical protein
VSWTGLSGGVGGTRVKLGAGLPPAAAGRRAAEAGCEWASRMGVASPGAGHEEPEGRGLSLAGEWAEGACE